MKNKLKHIILFFPHYNSLDQSGSLRSWQIGRFLASKGHHVTVFAPGVDLRKGTLFPEVRGNLYYETIVEGVRLIRPTGLENFRKSAFRRFLFEVVYAILAVIKAATIKNVDIFICAYPPAVVPLFAYILSLVKRNKFVFEVRDLMAEALTATRYVKSNFFRKVALFVENEIAKKSDHIVAVTPGIAKSLVKKGLKSDKISVITNGYEPEVFAEAQYNWSPRKRFGWGNKFVVIYAGGLTQSYDIPTLLKAAVSLRNEHDIHFVVVGEGERKESYINFCKMKKLNNVQFVGRKKRREMPVIMKDTNVGVQMFKDNPFWRIVLGNKTFDYLGSGIPMIYAGTGDTADLILSAEAGIVVPPGNDLKFAEAIKWLRDHPRQSKIMGENGKYVVTTKYNRKRLLQSFEDIFNRI